MYCKKCEKVIKEDVKFCSSCGDKLIEDAIKKTKNDTNEKTTCSNCKTEIKKNEKFCPNCGTVIIEKPNNSDSTNGKSKSLFIKVLLSALFLGALLGIAVGPSSKIDIKIGIVLSAVWAATLVYFIWFNKYIINMKSIIASVKLIFAIIYNILLIYSFGLAAEAISNIGATGGTPLQFMGFQSFFAFLSVIIMLILQLIANIFRSIWKDKSE